MSNGSGLSLGTVRQLLFLDRENGAVLHLDIPHNADAARLVGEFDVVAAGIDSGDAKALVMVDGPVAIVAALIGTPCILSGG